jgi:hypothetical protein
VAVTLAPAITDPDLSVTVPEKLPVACPHPDEAKHNESVKTKNAHNSFRIFSPPDITTPIRASHGIPQMVGAARKNKCCEGVYAETVQKHKSGVCGKLPCFEPSFGCISSVYGNAPREAREPGKCRFRPTYGIAFGLQGLDAVAVCALMLRISMAR